MDFQMGYELIQNSRNSKKIDIFNMGCTIKKAKFKNQLNVLFVKKREYQYKKKKKKKN